MAMAQEEAKDHAAKDQAAKDHAAKDQAAKDQAASRMILLLRPNQPVSPRHYSHGIGQCGSWKS
jgi:hypothetical protein